VSDKLEQVARAIFQWEYRDPRRAQPDIEPQWKLYEGAARAAIAAMREPSEEMILAAMAPYRYDIDDKMRNAFRETIRGYWNTMIDKILDEPPKP
jgi:hypothetical protein